MKTGISLLLLILIATSCSTIKPVMITGAENFRTENPLSKPEFKFDIGLKNPNNYGVTLKRMGVNVVLGDSTLAGINIASGQRIPRNTAVTIPVSVSPSVKMLTGIFMSGFKSMFSDLKNQKLEIRGEIVIRKFIFTKKIKLKESVNF